VAILGIPRDSFRNVNLVFCQTAEQADRPIWHIVCDEHGPRTPEAGQDGGATSVKVHTSEVSKPAALHRSLDAAYRSGLTDMVIEFRTACPGLPDDPHIRSMRTWPVLGHVMAISGADDEMRRLLATQVSNEHILDIDRHMDAEGRPTGPR
jgi:hypothetical protein